MCKTNEYKSFVGDTAPTASVDLNLDRTDDFVNQSGTSDILDLLDVYGGEVGSIETTDAEGNSVIITGRQNNDGDGSNTQADLLTQLQELGATNNPTNSIQEQQAILEKLQRKQRRQQGASSFLAGLGQGLGLLNRGGSGGQMQGQVQGQQGNFDNTQTASFAPEDSRPEWVKYAVIGLVGITAVFLIMNANKKKGAQPIVVPQQPTPQAQPTTTAKQ